MILTPATLARKQKTMADPVWTMADPVWTPSGPRLDPVWRHRASGAATQAQQLLGAGESPREVAEQLGIKLDTLRKAIRHRRLTVPLRAQPAEPTPEETAAPQPPVVTDKSTRVALDAKAEMGTACTRPDERVLAAFGLLFGASTRFETCRDVAFGGACALYPPWRPMACFSTSTTAWQSYAATTARCT